MKTTLIRRPRRRRVNRPKAGLWDNSATQVNIHAAKTHLSRLISRVEHGERITIARNGHAVAVIVPPPAQNRPPIPPDDSLLNLSQYTFKGSGGVLTNEDIDRIVYGV
jgi:prevent-host-death family protein